MQKTVFMPRRNHADALLLSALNALTNKLGSTLCSVAEQMLHGHEYITHSNTLPAFLQGIFRAFKHAFFSYFYFLHLVFPVSGPFFPHASLNGTGNQN